MVLLVSLLTNSYPHAVQWLFNDRSFLEMLCQHFGKT